jgi:enoyl-CoA hydratase/carnithine racemase
MTDHVLSERDGAVTTITFNRPDWRHCLNREVLPG